MTNETPKPPSSPFFSREMAETYDERNSRLLPISENMHFLIRLVLKELPPRARILCVGVGTGAEILSLAKANPEWTFVGVDPSAEMLRVCRERLRQEGILDRCDLVQGLVADAPEGAEFHAVLAILVAHFVPREDRAAFYGDIHDRLRSGGCFISTEICFALDSAEFPLMLKHWERVQALAGVSGSALEKLPEMLRDTLCVMSPAETKGLLRTTGFNATVQFFQAFMICGFHAAK